MKAALRRRDTWRAAKLPLRRGAPLARQTTVQASAMSPCGSMIVPATSHDIRAHSDLCAWQDLGPARGLENWYACVRAAIERTQRIAGCNRSTTEGAVATAPLAATA